MKERSKKEERVQGPLQHFLFFRRIVTDVGENPLQIASINPNNEKKIKNEDEISKLIKAFPKDNEDSFSNMRTILPAEIKIMRTKRTLVS